jgi:XTP/dITP diphosphohydrolase
MKLHCATTNPGKLREFQRAAGAGWEVEPLPGLRDIPPPAETGATFEENAILKARYYGAHTSGWLFTDDSGLEVAALGGAPGVHSAHFAGPAATDAENNARLVAELQGKADRRARYVCVIALARAGELVKTFRGEVEGEIVNPPRGAGGFGYDPHFFYPPFGGTFGEIPLERKQEVSHRGRALAAMFRWLALH